MLNHYYDLSTFPFLSEDFDMVSFDVHQIDPEEKVYTIVVRFDILEKLPDDSDKYKVTGGVQMRTGMVFQDIEDAGKLISTLINAGFFLQTVSAVGLMCDYYGEKITEVRWDRIMQLMRLPLTEDMYIQ
jgi:hypothetical protein